MFSGLLGFSAPVSITPAPVAVSVTPAPAVIAAPATVVEYIAPAPAVSYATPKCLLGRLRDQSKLAVRLLGRRHRILMEGRTPCVRAISSGMMGIVWCRNHSRSHELLSSVALLAEFTSCDKDSVLIL